MRRHEVTRLRPITRLKEDNSARPTCTSEQALVAAPERDKRWDRLTVPCGFSKAYHLSGHSLQRMLETL